MRIRVHSIPSGVVLAALLAARPHAQAEELISCGWDEIRGLRLAGTNLTTAWTWTGAGSNLPDAFKPRFTTTDECKPCPNNTVLVTSSGGATLDGAAALIRPATSNVLFYAQVPNAHSAELLPSNRVVVAASYHANGNRLIVFDLSRSDAELFSVPLHGAHGVVWDEQRQVLWGLADSYISGFALHGWGTTNPNFAQVTWTGLPSGGGHDLAPVPNSPNLLVTTDQHVWLFHRDTRTFTKHPVLGDTSAVKGVSMHPVTGRIAYVQADGPWWSERLRFLGPELTLHFPGDHFYKVRWVSPDAPELAINTGGTNGMMIQWSSVWTGYTLQENSSPTSTNWTASTEAVSEDGTNFFVVISPTGQRFFRLVRNFP